jgi:hypothetical protein
MRTGILTISLVTVVIIISPYACAFGEPNETNRFLTLRNYLEYAESHNAGLKSSYQHGRLFWTVRRQRQLPTAGYI